MKGQLSLELMIYASLAGISLLYAASLASSDSSGIRNAVSSYQTGVLVEAINDRVMAGAPGALQVYAPQALCGYPVNGSVLKTAYGSYYFITVVNASSQVFCGGSETLSITQINGAVRIERIQ